VGGGGDGGGGRVKAITRTAFAVKKTFSNLPVHNIDTSHFYFHTDLDLIPSCHSNFEVFVL
jgi:hypothetical protein